MLCRQSLSSLYRVMIVRHPESPFSLLRSLSAVACLATCTLLPSASALSSDVASARTAHLVQFDRPMPDRRGPERGGPDQRGQNPLELTPRAGAPRGGRKPEAETPPPARVDRSRNIEFLWALKAAPDADSAKLVETRIMALWQASGSDTADLLMTRVRQAVDAKDTDLGLQLLDAVVELQPGYAEGWNRRATLYFLKKDFGAAIDDLRQALAREPRHFGAMVGLGMILQELEEDRMALAVLRRAIELHPHLPRVPDMIRTLAEKVEGRAI